MKKHEEAKCLGIIDLVIKYISLFNFTNMSILNRKTKSLTQK